MYSLESYRYLLDLALKADYRFMGFTEECDTHGRCIYLRHDIDVSVDMAIELAQINSLLGIKGTFFLLLRSPYYNLFSYRTLDGVRKINDLGQRLGFHYHLPTVIPSTEDELANLILTDFSIVKDLIPEMEPIFAWHNGRNDLLVRSLSFTVPGLVNVYSSYFVKEVPYYADSNMRYSVAEFKDVIQKKDHKKLHLLFHPLNWVGGGKNMIEVWARTWKYLIWNLDREIRLNRAYGKHFRGGIPPSIVDRFASSIAKAGFKAE